MLKQRNRDITTIHDPVKKRNAKSKRTKHIMKKVHELAILCNLHVNFSIYDPKINKLVEFVTDPIYNIRKLSSMMNNVDLSSNTSDASKSFKYKLISMAEFLDSMGNTDSVSKVAGTDFCGDWDDMQSDAQTDAFDGTSNIPCNFMPTERGPMGAINDNGQ